MPGRYVQVSGSSGPNRAQEDVVSNGSRHRLSRGDPRRNKKLAALRGLITRESAVLAFELAADTSNHAGIQQALLPTVWGSRMCAVFAARTNISRWHDVDTGFGHPQPPTALTEWSVQHLPEVLAAHDAYDSRDEHAG